ncbi:MAG: dihydropyrimidinase [Dehalococcoidia bacterium]|nr:dihydropyrimidinase [Dehalococcoidia bacterium]
MYDLLIQGGRVVLPGSTVEADLGVTGEVIGAVGLPGALGDARRRIDARGLYVMPGGIDPHVHLRWAPIPEGPAGVHASTLSAACGGTTTVLDFATQGQGESLLGTVRKRLALAEGRMAVDYGLHCLVTNATPQVLTELGALVEAGVSSFKVMTAYRKIKWMLEDGAIYAVMAEAARCGALVGVHAENEDLIESATRNLLAQGKTGAENYGAGRPALAEGEAVRRTIYLARKAGAPLYVFHVTTRDGLEAVQQAQLEGQAVYGETCPHYLTFTDEVFQRPEPRLFSVIPPPRTEADQQALWAGIQGPLSCIGSDDAMRTVADKQQGDTFDQIPMGLAGMETRIPILYSEGVARGRITINRMAELTATGPARVFGLYPRKGIIAPGSDADLVLLDPSIRKKIRIVDLHQPNDYTVYEGRDVEGYPVMTILRGEVIVEQGQPVETKARGRFVPRLPFRSETASG